MGQVDDFDMRELAEVQEYVEELSNATLSRFGYSLDEAECAEWHAADVTVHDALEFINRGCGPGDAAGRSFADAFPEEEDDDE